jgi:hypothetical protein
MFVLIFDFEFLGQTLFRFVLVKFERIQELAPDLDKKRMKRKERNR